MSGNICTLQKELNHCQYYNPDTKECMSESTSCGFQKKPEQPAQQKEKWFEPYLKGTRKI